MKNLKPLDLIASWGLLGVILLVIGLSSGFCDIGFFQQLVANCAGVTFGIPIALWIERTRESGRRTAERIVLLNVLKDSVKKNLELAVQMDRQMATELSAGREIPTYSMDLALLEATSARKYELLGDLALAQRIDDVRYELIHFNEKLLMFRNYYVNTSHSAFSQNMAAQLLSVVKNHLPSLRENLGSALKLIEEKIGESNISAIATTT